MDAYSGRYGQETRQSTRMQEIQNVGSGRYRGYKGDKGYRGINGMINLFLPSPSFPTLTLCQFQKDIYLDTSLIDIKIIVMARKQDASCVLKKQTAQ